MKCRKNDEEYLVVFPQTSSLIFSLLYPQLFLGWGVWHMLGAILRCPSLFSIPIATHLILQLQLSITLTRLQGPRRQSPNKPNLQFVPFLLRNKLIDSTLVTLSNMSGRHIGQKLLKSKYCRLLLTSNSSQTAEATKAGKTLHFTPHKRKGLKNSW